EDRPGARSRRARGLQQDGCGGQAHVLRHALVAQQWLQGEDQVAGQRDRQGGGQGEGEGVGQRRRDGGQGPGQGRRAPPGGQELGHGRHRRLVPPPTLFPQGLHQPRRQERLGPIAVLVARQRLEGFPGGGVRRGGTHGSKQGGDGLVERQAVAVDLV